MKRMEITGESLAELMGPDIAAIEELEAKTSSILWPESKAQLGNIAARFRLLQALLREGRLIDSNEPPQGLDDICPRCRGVGLVLRDDGPARGCPECGETGRVDKDETVNLAEV